MQITKLGKFTFMQANSSVELADKIVNFCFNLWYCSHDLPNVTSKQRTSLDLQIDVLIIWSISFVTVVQKAWELYFWRDILALIPQNRCVDNMERVHVSPHPIVHRHPFPALYWTHCSEDIWEIIKINYVALEMGWKWKQG